MNLATFLVAMVGPLTARLITTLGITLVTMTGLTIAVSTLRGMILSNAQSLPSDAIALAGLFGIWECIGIVLGGATFVITWASTTGIIRLAKAT